MKARSSRTTVVDGPWKWFAGVVAVNDVCPISWAAEARGATGAATVDANTLLAVGEPDRVSLGCLAE